MGRNNGSNALAIFAMIIAIGSLGLSGYMFFIWEPLPQGEEQAITEIWYDSRESVYAPGTSYNTVPDLELTITVNEGESVFIQFNGEFIVTPLATTSGGSVRLRIDDTTISGTEMGFLSDSSYTYHWGDVTLLYVATGLSAGTHTINIQAAVSGGSGNIQSMNLLAYTFK